jgi:hypothetical protein
MEFVMQRQRENFCHFSSNIKSEQSEILKKVNEPIDPKAEILKQNIAQFCSPGCIRKLGSPDNLELPTGKRGAS